MCMVSSIHMCVFADTLAGTPLAVVMLSPTRYDTKVVCSQAHASMRVENTLAGPHPAVTALSLVRYGTKVV